MEWYEKAYQDYLDGMKYQAIADKYGVSLSAVKSRANRDWKTKKVATKSKKSCNLSNKKLQPKAAKVAIKKREPREVAADDVDEELTPKQRLFCVYYSKSFNSTQSYINAYDVDYTVAAAAGSRMLRNVKVKAEVDKLIDEQIQELNVRGESVVEYHLRAAFSNITDFVEFGNKQKPIMHQGKPVMMPDPRTGEEKAVAQEVNIVKLRNSNRVDGQLVAAVTEGRDGVSVRLVDRHKSLAFLAEYFKLNPMSKHKIDYDNARLELERQRIEGDDKGNSMADDWIEAHNDEVDGDEEETDESGED
jgi:phage terminase small subunit